MLNIKTKFDTFQILGKEVSQDEQHTQLGR